jgi:predicted transcriptional regulator of viral defense system
MQNLRKYRRFCIQMKKSPDYNELYRIAEGQAGYFNAKQAREAGFSWERLSANVRNKRFMRAAQGVYRLNHFPASPFEDLFVAWLRAKSSAVVSHESALALYELSDVLPSEVHLIVPRTASQRRKGIRQHTQMLKPEEVTRRNGLPVTTVERTLVDVIKSGLAQEQIHKAGREALQRGLTDRGTLLRKAAEVGGKIERVIREILASENDEVR